MSFRPIASEIRNQILERIKSGTSAATAAHEHGVSPKTVYGWLARSTASAPGILEASRWQREKRCLLEMIGLLSFELTKIKKNRSY